MKLFQENKYEEADKDKKILFVVVIVLVLISAAGISLFSKKNQMPAGNIINNSQNSGIAAAVNNYNSGSIKAKCSIYDSISQNSGYQANDDGILPKDIAEMADKADLCGSLLQTNSVYYAADSAKNNLLSDYEVKLKSRGCVTESIRSAGQEQLNYAYYLPFTCDDGKGYAVADADFTGYILIFQ